MNYIGDIMLKKVYIEITNSCNLKCDFCIQNSSNVRFIEEDKFKIILKKLKGYTNYLYFHILGEPLLHPSIIEIIKIARQNFKGEINICTNGILVDKQSPEFFKACRDNEVSIAITIYPIKLNWQKIEELLAEYEFNLIKVGTKNHDRRLWFKNHRDLSGSQDIEGNYSKCRWGNNCIILEHGRLATCVMPFKTKYYNEYYNKDVFNIPESDSISIYECDDINEILRFLSKSVSCCRYCLPDKDELIDWEVSKKDIEEWS